jgi:hypothetical protein
MFFAAALVATLIAPLSAPALAGWATMRSGTEVKVAKGTMTVKPLADWNRSSQRPSRRSEAWTRDGINLNELTFFGGISNGESILRQGWAATEKLPRFKSDMLPTDLAEIFESTHRMVLQSPVFKMGKVEPAKLGTHDAVRFNYSYAAQAEDIERRGEAVAAIVDGKLYLVNFVAPSLHYFDADIGEVRAMVAGIAINPPAAKPATGGKKKKKKATKFPIANPDIFPIAYQDIESM